MQDDFCTLCKRETNQLKDVILPSANHTKYVFKMKTGARKMAQHPVQFPEPTEQLTINL